MSALVERGPTPPVVIFSPPDESVSSTRDTLVVQPSESLFAEPVVISGTLQKMGRRLKRWHPRYFELRGTKFHYYRNPSKQNYLGAIDLNICYYVGLSAVVSFGSTFELQTLDRSHVLAARSREDREKWMTAIKEKTPHSKEAAEEKRKKEKERSVSLPRRWLSFKNDGDDHLRRPKATVERKESLMERLFTRRRKLSAEINLEEHLASEGLHTLTNVQSLSTPNSPIGRRISLASAEGSPQHHPAPGTQERISASPDLEIASLQLPVTPRETQASGSTAVMTFPSNAAINELRNLLNSLPETKAELSYDSWPPLSGEATWQAQPTAIEQLRHFLISCP